MLFRLRGLFRARALRRAPEGARDVRPWIRSGSKVVRRQVGGAHPASGGSRAGDATTATGSCRTCSWVAPGTANPAENGSAHPGGAPGGAGKVVGLRKAAPHLTSSHARRPSHFVSANNLMRCRAGGVDARVAQTLNRARRARKSFFRLPRNTPEINTVRRRPQGRRRPAQGPGAGPRASGIQALPGEERRRSRTRERRRRYRESPIPATSAGLANRRPDRPTIRSGADEIDSKPSVCAVQRSHQDMRDGTAPTRP